MNKGKNNKKKNILIVAFVILLVIFIGLMIFIVLKAKERKEEKYIPKNNITIKEMMTTDYELNNNIDNFQVVNNLENFNIIGVNEDYQAHIVNKKLIYNKDGQDIELKLITDNSNIDENIKLIYQNLFYNLILTEDGKLYQAENNYLDENNNLVVNQIFSDYSISSLLLIDNFGKNILALTQDNKLLNISTLKEYNGIINEYKNNDITLYVYSDNSFSLEKDKVIIDENGNKIKFDIWFENKIIDKNGMIYEIDLDTKIIKTSKLNKLISISYKKQDDIYIVNIETTTGKYKINSKYYYTN